MTSKLKKITIYTDGACLGNPGPGGYGVVLIQGPNRLELSGGYQLTTNNRMEIMAAIVGLEALQQECQVALISDSQYLVNAIEKGWAEKWKANRWMRNKTEQAVNPDLWERLLLVCRKHDITFSWVRGHSGTKENERCDRLAVAAAKGKGLPVDEGYRA